MSFEKASPLMSSAFNPASLANLQKPENCKIQHSRSFICRWSFKINPKGICIATESGRNSGSQTRYPVEAPITSTRLGFLNLKSFDYSRTRLAHEYSQTSYWMRCYANKSFYSWLNYHICTGQKFI